jgi:hypothetical protein
MAGTCSWSPGLTIRSTNEVGDKWAQLGTKIFTISASGSSRLWCSSTPTSTWCETFGMYGENLFVYVIKICWTCFSSKQRAHNLPSILETRASKPWIRWLIACELCWFVLNTTRRCNLSPYVRLPVTVSPCYWYSGLLSGILPRRSCLGLLVAISLFMRFLLAPTDPIVPNTIPIQTHEGAKYCPYKAIC